MYKNLSNTGIVMVTIVVMFSIIQVVISSLSNKTDESVREGMSSGSTTLPTDACLDDRNNQSKSQSLSDPVILNDMNML